MRTRTHTNMMYVLLKLQRERFANGKVKKGVGPSSICIGLRRMREALFLQVQLVAQVGGGASWVLGRSVGMV